ncbi:DUF3606 domain-containing protein [Variovorax sp. M-6]|uniref:DUF3606 domain-containing protein n=1 Tax=Variovorax sp. M-6 TaxID=3233041 RepID=UPI003F94A1CF
MSDDLHARDERSSIDINKASEVQYWCERLGVSEQVLRQTVADVGVSAEQVAERLGVR